MDKQRRGGKSGKNSSHKSSAVRNIHSDKYKNQKTNEGSWRSDPQSHTGMKLPGNHVLNSCPCQPGTLSLQTVITERVPLGQLHQDTSGLRVGQRSGCWALYVHYDLFNSCNVCQLHRIIQSSKWLGSPLFTLNFPATHEEYRLDCEANLRP